MYDLPEEVVLNEGLISGGPFFAYLSDRYPELKLAFTYDFILTGDGRYRIEIVYDDDFVRDATESGTERINNILSCRCWISSDDDVSHNGLEVDRISMRIMISRRRRQVLTLPTASFAMRSRSALPTVRRLT